jgi:hypothetical protein
MKQVGLGFPSFASKSVKERRRIVHMASLWMSRESETKDDRHPNRVYKFLKALYGLKQVSRA